MIHRQTGLGRGLGAIIPQRSGAIRPATEVSVGAAQTATPAPPESGTFLHIPVSLIVPNPKQPRRHFEHAALEDLVSSIKEHGIVEPLVATRLSDGTYELVAGERRLRAAQIAGLETVPCVVRSATEQEKLELALIENVQRQDLNPIEEAVAYQRLMDEFGLTQDQVSAKVGKSRPQVANMVRLLQLPEDIQQALMDRKISASNARTLLSLPTDQERRDLFQAMLAGNFTVRQAEARVPHPRRARAAADPNVQDAERRLRESLGHRVEIKRSPNGAGEIRIAFENDEDLRDLTSRLA